jgi:hypothetical protein
MFRYRDISTRNSQYKVKFFCALEYHNLQPPRLWAEQLGPAAYETKLRIQAGARLNPHPENLLTGRIADIIVLAALASMGQ